ncbi:AcrR family transcriptional regulator [Kibdelosporangium banguiense]|uniref:AcrR family transcriptional regulator n=1 Tax=Kibdelosporangium banguiense TaxID=1365924 RepID=A0ABS4TZ30_9PSEU|nr:TetR/AcrR family transcriptional regulator [Kibdelosporangium banguiense]MBP2329671.1 AcrR family transcriptional regulator [Kibdelosporangium banguiense]
MSPTRAEQAEKTKSAVLQTARRLFVEHGFDATSLQLIADTMGVTKANVYYYFRTKIEILEALFEGSVTGLADLLDKAETIQGKRARTEFLAEGFVDQVVTAHRTLAPMNRTDPIIRRHEGISQRLDELSERGMRLLFGDNPTLDQQAAYAMLNDLGPAMRRLNDLPDDEMRAVLKRLCMHMLRV